MKKEKKKRKTKTGQMQTKFILQHELLANIVDKDTWNVNKETFKNKTNSNQVTKKSNPN